VNCLSHFLIISTVLTYCRLTLISQANLQWCMVTWPCDIAVSHHVTVWHCNIASHDRETLQCHMVTWSRDRATLQCRITWPCDIAILHHMTVRHCSVTWPCDIAVSHGHMVTWQCNIAMLHGRLPTCSLFDNDERHVTAFRPISEAAHSWSCDKCRWLQEFSTGWILVPVILSVTWKALVLQRSLLVGYPITVDEMDRTVMLDSSAVLSGD